MILGHPALLLLARRKFAGTLRRQVRRVRTLKGAFFALAGLCFIGFYLFTFLFQGALGPHADPALMELIVSGALLVMTVLQFASALGYRGLFMLPGEIETLFAAPLSRSQLIRYRLVSSAVRSLLSAAIFSFFLARRAPQPASAFAACALALLTLAVAGQAVALLAGDAENRVAARLAKLPLRGVAIAATLALILGVFALATRHPLGVSFEASSEEWLGSLEAHPLVRVLRAPFVPWARAISAPTPAQFWPWFALCLAIYAALFELTARIRVDYRELSLETSANVAKRLARMRRGLGVAGEAPSARARKRGMPWLAGRGPLGAIAWRKAVGIMRKSITSLNLGALIVAVITIGALQLVPVERHPVWQTGLLVCGAGTVYLCMSLRFDFREDLEVMTLVKAWPLAPWKVFLATLLPEVALVSALIAVAIVGLALYAHQAHPLLALEIAVVPLLVAAWASIDNAAFLFAPTRLAPGQDSALQSTGRALLLLFARLVAVLVVVLVAGVPAFVLSAAGRLGPEGVAAVGLSVGALILAGELVGLVLLGGEVLRRFDVARDRG